MERVSTPIAPTESFLTNPLLDSVDMLGLKTLLSMLDDWEEEQKDEVPAV